MTNYDQVCAMLVGGCIQIFRQVFGAPIQSDLSLSSRARPPKGLLMMRNHSMQVFSASAHQYEEAQKQICSERSQTFLTFTTCFFFLML